MFLGHLDYLQKPPLGGRPNTKPGDLALRMLTTVVGLFYIIMCEDLHDYRFIEVAFVDGLVTYNFIVHLRVHYHTT